MLSVVCHACLLIHTSPFINLVVRTRDGVVNFCVNLDKGIIITTKIFAEATNSISSFAYNDYSARSGLEGCSRLVTTGIRPTSPQQTGPQQ